MEKMTIDMHVHSLVSDGLYNPSEVVEIAVKNNIRGLVFAEHNSVHSNFYAIKEYAESMGVNIPFAGTEVNTVYVKNDIPLLKFHLLVYGNQVLDEEFQDMISLGNKVQNEYVVGLHNELLKKNVISRKFQDILDDINEKNEKLKYIKKMYTRSILVNEILRREKYNSWSIDEVKTAFLPQLDKSLKYKEFLDIKAVIHTAKNKGAVCVLAHPGWVRNIQNEPQLGLYDLQDVILDLKQCGLDGIEVNHRLNNDEARIFFRNIALQNDMIVTGGSDYHGKPRCIIGENTTEMEQFNEICERMK